MYLQRIDLPQLRSGRGQYTIYPIGDLHLDQKAFAKKKFLAYRQRILDDSGDKLCVFVGDCVEGHVPSHRHFNPDAIRRDFLAGMDEYVRLCLDEAEALLKPITDAGIPLIIVEGNHDRFLEFVGFSAMVSARVHGKYLGGEGFVTVYSGRKGKRQRSVLYCTHGYGGGRKDGASVNNMRDYMNSFKADVYIAGHVHKSFAQIIPIFGASESGTEIVKRHVSLIRTPSFIERATKDVVTYASRKGYPTSDESLVAVRMDPVSGRMRRVDLDVEE